MLAKRGEPPLQVDNTPWVPTKSNHSLNALNNVAEFTMGGSAFQMRQTTSVKRNLTLLFVLWCSILYELSP